MTERQDELDRIFDYFFTGDRLLDKPYPELVRIAKRHLACCRKFGETPPTWDPEEIALAVMAQNTHRRAT